MIALRLCGALGQAHTFHRALDLRRVRRMGAPRRWRADYHELLAEARTLGQADTADALSAVMGESFSLAPLWGRARRGLGRTAFRLPPWLLRCIVGKRIRSWRTCERP